MKNVHCYLRHVSVFLAQISNNFSIMTQSIQVTYDLCCMTINLNCVFDMQPTSHLLLYPTICILHLTLQSILYV